MGILHSFKPTRDAKKHNEPMKLIADLDAIISQPIGFKYLGNQYVIEPLTTESYMDLILAYQNLQFLLKRRDEQDGTVTLDQTYEAYYTLMHSVCPTITLSEIKKGKLIQLSAMLGLMIKHITGDTAPLMAGSDPFEMSDEKKKNVNPSK